MVTPQGTTYVGTVGGWQTLLVPLKANSEAFPHLDAPRSKFETLVARAMELNSQQATLQAAKQEVSQQLRALLPEGRRLAAFLRSGVREHFGPRSEKLAEFNLQPFRGRTRKPKPAPEEPAKPGGDSIPPTVIPKAPDTPPT